MGIADRVFNIAKGYLDKATQRWDELDEKARQELESYTASPSLSAWDRAQAKIDQTNAANEATTSLRPTPPPTPVRDTLKDLPPGYEPPIPQSAQASQSSTIDAAYRVLGVAPGSTFDVVKKAYDRLRTRTANDKFPAGSKELEQAKKIERRATAAYMLLVDTLNPGDDRFGRLEL
jgi:DnaJ-domain-containing protein 1